MRLPQQARAGTGRRPAPPGAHRRLLTAEGASCQPLHFLVVSELRRFPYPRHLGSTAAFLGPRGKGACAISSVGSLLHSEFLVTAESFSPGAGPCRLLCSFSSAVDSVRAFPG